MLVNGKASCTSNSKHVAIKYFWCTDRIKKGKISVRHCPTEKMVADYMSKPLQGKLFISFRHVLMGWEHISTLFDIFSSTEKRVENSSNLAVKPKNVKLSYAEVVRVTAATDIQDRIISNGGDPTSNEIQVDIKKK